jgi:hypothetical protein
MAAHVYWRVRFTKSSGSATDIWLDEVSFRSAADADLSTGGTAIASGIYDATYPASNAFDKTVANAGWASPLNTFPCWIGYQHPSAVDVASVVVTCADHADASDELPVDRAVFLEWSDDGTNWTAAGQLTYRTDGGWAASSVVRLVAGSPGTSKLVGTSVNRLNGNVLSQTPLRGVFVRGAYARFDLVDGGSGTISGLVTIENIPGSRKVRLYRKHDGRLMRETWSAPNGAYSFANIDPTLEYFVVAHDHLRVYNGVIQDMLTP